MGTVLVIGGLAVLWFGVCGFLVHLGFDDGMPLLAVIGGVLAIIGVGFGLAAFEDSVREHIALPKSDWTCTDTDTFTQPVLVGKVLVNQTQTVCTEYSRGARP